MYPTASAASQVTNTYFLLVMNDDRRFVIPKCVFHCYCTNKRYCTSLVQQSNICIVYSDRANANFSHEELVSKYIINITITFALQQATLSIATFAARIKRSDDYIFSYQHFLQYSGCQRQRLHEQRTWYSIANNLSSQQT